ncbi:MAG: hypothetical protein ACRCZ0_08620 [Cetobacterium sp.]
MTLTIVGYVSSVLAVILALFILRAYFIKRNAKRVFFIIYDNIEFLLDSQTTEEGLNNINNLIDKLIILNNRYSFIK